MDHCNINRWRRGVRVPTDENVEKWEPIQQDYEYDPETQK